MPSRPSRAIVDETQVGHDRVVSRSVRRARLAGVASRTGPDFSHRKNWLHDRIAVLVGILAVEARVTALLDNHLHFELRNRPDIVALWSDLEVARRWLRLHGRLLYLLLPAGDETVREFMKSKQRLLKIPAVVRLPRCVSERNAYSDFAPSFAVSAFS